MRIKFSLVFLLIALCLQAQDINNLDSKYGFNKFKLETPLSQLKSKCKYLSSFERADMYRYIGPKIRGVFGYFEVETLNLKFYKGKLMEIEINLGSLTSENTSYIDKELFILYGNPQRKLPSNDDMELAKVWVGNKSFLLFQKSRQRYSFPSEVKIIVASQKLMNEQKNDQF